MIKTGKEITFDKQSHFIYERPLGRGGTGNTHLFKDLTTGMYFAFKKYEPYDESFREEFYKRFVDEIKILFQLSHPNIVRIFNYYLYPSHQTGYIQMEYVNGVSIDEYSPFSADYENVFIQVINGFSHLQNNGILHRDVRAANIMVTSDGTVKILDFGFGKKLENEDDIGKSVMLNWPVSEYPDEIKYEGHYTHQSEIYFVGKLFREILLNNTVDGQNFKYLDIVDKMSQVRTEDRYKSFDEILGVISQGALRDLDFTESEKHLYRTFADILESHLVHFKSEFSPIYDVPSILNSLENLLRDSILEKYVQANNYLISCFLKNGYKYKSKKDIEVSIVQDFYRFLQSKKPKMQKVILDNLYLRLGTIPVQSDEFDDLPF
jgi:serine/threonine protein kinase